MHELTDITEGMVDLRTTRVPRRYYFTLLECSVQQ